MAEEANDAAAKFDARAAEYDRQSRIALAGYDACHELAACMLSAALGPDLSAKLLIVGSGTGNEIISIGALEPSWTFTAVDPAPAMVAIAQAKLRAAGLSARVTTHRGYVDELPRDPYDAATLIGVLHHLRGREAKQRILTEIAARLKPGAPLVLAGNHYQYASHPLMLAAWRNRWRANGMTADEIEARMGKILEGADPPASEQAVADLLAEAGFGAPTRFFSSLFWGAWLSRGT